MRNDEMNEIALSARVLGALFYYPPDAPETAGLVAMLENADWSSQWPLATEPLDAIAAGFCSRHVQETREEAWQRLFIGPWALPAPPWGSVWLDRESVIFGDSTLALRQWMRESNIAFEAQRNEPEDHIGLLLLLAAWLAEKGDADALEQLLAWHLLPWAPRFLELFVAGAQHPFYEALGRLTQLTLASWRSHLVIPVADKPLYR